ncbi:MAG: ABC transporter permease subunit [Hamadaea sp.]|uniref:ABC transporter permease n=1 Tax=Hamadaea sp. TaxID=2024425 RepID=UPI00185402F0|nr:ABC transporter permease subunit [Hamadaea sp.]NUR73006.1 ABC transporter permease subunit [Hamadaea sp.]NUT18049.1 ABC transporter permease subunit [Hamadaea sp.]
MTAVAVLPERRARWRRITTDRWAVAGGVTVAALLLIALAAPLLAGLSGQDPYTYHLDALDDSGVPVGFGGGIGSAHWFGVEPLTGRDLFAITVYGARTSILVGLAATMVSVFLGALVGVTAGFFGGWYDRIVGRAIDVLFGFPTLILMIALGAIAPVRFPKQLLVVGVIGLFGWPGIARVVRGQTLALKQRTFVVASVSLGAGSGHVLRRQVLPNLAATIIVYATMLADRVAVMHRGRIVETGPTSVVLRTPSDPYTRRLLAAAPVADPVRQRSRRAALAASLAP